MALHTRHNARRAVAPVLATLLMIAVAVAMSVIIFMWSQGFLSNTSGATGSQQGQQNVAAQSSIAIETATFSGTTTTVFIRNVGGVSVKIALIQVSGIAANAGFKTAVVANSGTAGTVGGVAVTFPVSLSKGSLLAALVTGLTGLTSGDVVNVKGTTDVGTFASAQYTVP